MYPCLRWRSQMTIPALAEAPLRRAAKEFQPALQPDLPQVELFVMAQEGSDPGGTGFGWETHSPPSEGWDRSSVEVAGFSVQSHMGKSRLMAQSMGWNKEHRFLEPASGFAQMPRSLHVGHTASQANSLAGLLCQGSPVGQFPAGRERCCFRMAQRWRCPEAWHPCSVEGQRCLEVRHKNLRGPTPAVVTSGHEVQKQ